MITFYNTLYNRDVAHDTKSIHYIYKKDNLIFGRNFFFVSKRLINNWILYLTFNKKALQIKIKQHPICCMYEKLCICFAVQLLWHIFAAGLQIELSFSIWSTTKKNNIKKLGFGKEFLSLFLYLFKLCCFSYFSLLFFINILNERVCGK